MASHQPRKSVVPEATIVRVLVCGASGFIGRAITERLAQDGHTVLRGVRTPQRRDDIEINYSRDFAPNDWVSKLADVDAVVNAIGIIIESRDQRFDDIHRHAPCALFSACAAAGVQRVVQISALGAELGTTPYYASKYAADCYLQSLPVEWQILRPGLVYGARGSSAIAFRTLASLPITPLPDGGQSLLQPIHIDDLVDAVSTLLSTATAPRQCVALVGPTPLRYRDMLRVYRTALGFAPAIPLSIPVFAMRLLAQIGGRLPGVVLTPDNWRMLQAGSIADPGASCELLGHSPKAIDEFIPATDAPTLRQNALAEWRTSLLRAALAAVWFGTAIVSTFIYPLSSSLALLGQVGLHGTSALAAFYGAIVMDLAFGLATLLRPGRRLWWLQLLLISFYSVVITITLPEYWAHPFGPILKNLPILAILFILVAEERRP